MQTWNEVLSWLHFAVKSCLMTKKVDDSLISCSEFLTLGVFPQTAVSLFKMLTIHFFFWQWPLLRHNPRAKISAVKSLQTVLLFAGKKVGFFCAVLYGPGGKWKQMSSTREQLIHCCELPPRLFTCLSEALIAILSLAISFAACLPRSCCGHKQCCFTKKKKLCVYVVTCCHAFTFLSTI